MTTIQESSSEFIKVSETNPCPLCGKSDWCKVSPDSSVVMCGRTDTAPTGWKRIKETTDGQGIYKLETENNFQQQVSGRRPVKRTSKPKPALVPPVPIGIKLARVENATVPERQPISDTLWPIVKKEILKKTPGINREDVWQIAYSYGDDKTVYRAEWADETSAKGYRKTYRQSHIDDGLLKWEKGKAVWDAYRIDEVLGILDNAPINEPVVPLMVEGEPNVELARSHGMAAITLQGSNWTEEQIKAVVKELQRLNCRALPYLYDNDDIGRAKANKIKAVCSRLQFPCILIDPVSIFPDIPEKGDIKEIVIEMSVEEFIRRIEAELHSRAVQDKEHQQNLARGDSDGSKKSDKPPLPQIIGGWFAEDLRERLLYSDQHQSWMSYELKHKGVWTAVGDNYVLSAIEAMCRQRGIYPNNAYVSNVLGTMKRMLFCLEWTERPSNELLPFEDGVLFIESGNFQEHAPGFRLTWSLPRQFRGSAVNINGWGSIASWLDEATEGNNRKKEILLAFAAASLRGMANLHKFLMLTGPGGTGKGVFSQLLTMVLGERNTWIGNLEDLSKADRIAELQTKRLALFDDQERYMGNLSNFRSLTGGGQISGRKLYKDPINFHFKGLALITANQPCFPASGISWLKRRIIQEEFRHHPSRPNVYLQKQLEPELSAFTQYLLSIPVAEIERILSPESTGVNLTFWEDRIQADPLASWINDHIIHETGAFTAIGSDKDEWKEGDYDPTKSTLFGGYNLTCRQGNSIPLSKNKFSANLVELCQSVLGWRDVAKIRKGDARYIVGIRFRTAADSAILPLDQTLNDDERQHDVNLNDNLKAIQDMGCADLDDLLSKNLEKNTSTEELVQKMNFESESSTADLFIEKSGDSDANVSTSHTQQGNGSTLESSSTSSTGLSQSNLLLLQDYARRIMEALGYQSPPIARAISRDIQRSIAAGEVFSTSIAEFVGAETYQAFTTLRLPNEKEEELVKSVRQAIASNDAETAKSVLVSLKEVCDSGAADRRKVWHSLTESERAAFKTLLD